MNKLLLFLTIIVSWSFHAQNEVAKPLEKLYLKAIKARVDLTLINGEIYFEPNKIINQIKDSVQIPNFHFLENNRMVDNLITQYKVIILYRVAHKRISKDTMDVNFPTARLTLADRNIKKYKFKTMMFGRFDTKNYAPDLRFVFDHGSKDWILIKNNLFVVN